MKLLLLLPLLFIFSCKEKQPEYKQEITISEVEKLYNSKYQNQFDEILTNKGFGFYKLIENQDSCDVFEYHTEEGNFILKYRCDNGGGTVIYNSPLGDVNYQSFINEGEKLGFKLYEKDVMKGEKYFNLLKGKIYLSIVISKDEKEGEYFTVNYGEFPVYTKLKRKGN